jgi:hypothetical protein
VKRGLVLTEQDLTINVAICDDEAVEKKSGIWQKMAVFPSKSLHRHELIVLIAKWVAAAAAINWSGAA